MNHMFGSLAPAFPHLSRLFDAFSVILVDIAVQSCTVIEQFKSILGGRSLVKALCCRAGGCGFDPQKQKLPCVKAAMHAEDRYVIEITPSPPLWHHQAHFNFGAQDL